MFRFKKVIYLYDNNITHISGLSNLKNLTQLYLQNNKIEKIDGLNQLTNLVTLYYILTILNI